MERHELVSLGSGLNNSVHALTVWDDGGGAALYAGGNFTTAGGVAANRIAKWDGSSWTPLGSGMNNGVRTLAAYDGGSGSELYAGGNFTTAGGTAALRVAKWDCQVPPPLPPTTYCTGKTSSAGCVPFLSYSGRPSTTGTVIGFNVSSNDHVESAVGFFLYSFKRANLNFHGGKLCLKAPFTRVAGLVNAVNGIPCTRCAGSCRRLRRNFNQLIQSGTDPLLTAGQTMRLQFRQRDPSDPTGFGDNLSNALSFVIAP